MTWYFDGSIVTFDSISFCLVMKICDLICVCVMMTKQGVDFSFSLKSAGG